MELPTGASTPGTGRRLGPLRIAAGARPAIAVLLLTAAAALLAGSAPPDGAAPAPLPAGAALPVPAFDLDADLAAAAAPALPAADVAAAAAALRRRDCDAAVARFDPLVTRPGGPGSPSAVATFARVVQGLYAHACEDVELAEAKLLAAERPGGAFDDWRLFVLADSAAARDHSGVARAALARLLAAYPASPLAERALVRAADLAWAQGDAVGALELVEQARREGTGHAAAAQLEALAWGIGTALADPAVRTAAARRLLIEAPLEATRLKVADAFRAPDGSIDWPALLTADELARRAASFLALDMAPAALATLDQVAPAARDGGWLLLEARALTADRRGLAALELLADAEPGSAREGAELEWARAMAALDAATAYRGRVNLPSAERLKMRRAAQLHLAAAAAVSDDALGKRALARLFVELSEENRFDEAMDALRRLRQIDPGDATGARYLWELGWGQYAARNYSGAVGYWAELEALYPDHRDARSGRYWTARAFAALGETERARRIFAEVAAADTTDFYRKYALARLAGGPAAAASPAPAAPAGAGADPAEPWPDDRPLARARLLSDLGLDDLAEAELAGLGDAVDPRAASALAAVVAVRRGDLVESIAQIRRAFPALGGPNQARVPPEALRLYYPLQYREVIRVNAERTRLPVHLLYAMIRQESAFDPAARSRAGARGLMQVMPATGRELARRLGLSWSTAKLVEPAYNLQLGTAYFRQVLEMFDDNVDLALAGYNGGPYRIKRLWSQAGAGRELDAFLEGLSVEESRTYVKRILVLTDSYRRLYPDGGS